MGIFHFASNPASRGAALSDARLRDGGAVAVAAAVSLVGGLFMKGSNINYPAGTDFQVEVRDNVDLGVTPEELKDAMNPNIPHGQEIVIEVK